VLFAVSNSQTYYRDFKNSRGVIVNVRCAGNAAANSERPSNNNTDAIAVAAFIFITIPRVLIIAWMKNTEMNNPVNAPTVTHQKVRLNTQPMICGLLAPNTCCKAIFGLAM
jgi:hypothetical protein